MKTPHDVNHGTLGRRISMLTVASLLVILGTACSSTAPADETELDDIEVHVPSQAEADATASNAITAENADTELQKLDDEVAGDQY